MKKLLFLLVVASLVAAGCHHGITSEIKGSGKRELQKRDVSPFTSITTEGAFTIEVVCQKDLSLEVEGDDNVLPFVSSEISGNVLRLSNTQGYSINEPVKFRISVPNLEGISVTGAGKIAISGMNNEKFEIDSEGAPAINVSGKTKMIAIATSGAATIDTHNLLAARAVVDSRGVSQVEINVAEHLDATVSGPSSVFYRGNPVVSKTISGPGKVEKRSDEGA